MKQMAGVITTWLIGQGVIGEKDRELYEYAVHSFFWDLAPVVYALVIGLLMQDLAVSVVLILPFVVMRKFSGGCHAESAWVCLICSCLLLIGCVYLAKHIPQGIGFSLIVLAGVLGLIRFSPVDSKNRRLDDEEKRERKRDTTVLGIIFYIIHILLWVLHQEQYAVCIGVGILLTALLQLPCVINRHHT